MSRNDAEVCELSSPQVYNDSRFNIILNNSREIKNLINELNEMANNKFGNMLGHTPQPRDNEKVDNPSCWVDEVITVQNLSLTIVRETLEKINSI